jgi:nucleotide-binding universal stress UspA family protein
MNSLLVGIDGSPGSRRAAEFASDLARRYEAQLTVLHVVEPLPESLLAGSGVSADSARERRFLEGERMLHTMCDELGLHRAERIIELGEAPETICAEAEDRDVDLVVVGAHGNGPHRCLAGSVSMRLVHMSPRSVTIVR